MPDSEAVREPDDQPGTDEPLAWFGGRLATGLEEVTDDLTRLDSAGWWAVVVTFEGQVTAARFRRVREAPLPAGRWPTQDIGAWRSTLDRQGYESAVRRVRAQIAVGEVYQVNVCRVLSAACPDDADIVGLARLLAAGNPAPYGGAVRLPGHDVHVASASPELFLRREGDMVESGPIKGTGRTAADLTEKDRAENIMITDLVRNDLGAVAVTGSVTVPDLCVVEQHPGLVHLVSRVRARLRPGVGWSEVLGATFPPGSVSGAPKASALRIIGDLEPAPRGPYCGAIGWVDAGSRTAVLAVGIRSFWRHGAQLHFGTGAGITWGSDPGQEWAETQLKARHLVGLAGGSGRIAP
ncbi:MAG: para-aminobenzoate synthetase component [Actinomycetota bacterium]|nr:para-aminobenzoate synthetase component [Actinomycetota bacterium]